MAKLNNLATLRELVEEADEMLNNTSPDSDDFLPLLDFNRGLRRIELIAIRREIQRQKGAAHVQNTVHHKG